MKATLLDMSTTLIPDDLRGRHPHPDSDVQNRYRLNDLFSAVWLSEAVVAAIRLGLPEAIEEEALGCDRLARQLDLNRALLYRLLRALAANGIFEECGPGQFQHTSLSRQLRADHPYSYQPMARLWGHPQVRRSWECLPSSLANAHSGIQNATGRPLYAQLQQDPEMAETFTAAMVSNSSHASRSLAEAIPVQDTLVDLAGGVGTLLVTFLQAHPTLRGVVYDLDYLEAPAAAYFRSAGVEDRARFEKGDFTQSVPTGADTYLVKNTLWNFADEPVLQVFKQVRRALLAHPGQFYIIEYMLEPDNAAWTTVWDLQMLNLPGGRARSPEDYQSLLQAAGLSLHSKVAVEDQTVLRATLAD